MVLLSFFPFTSFIGNFTSIFRHWWSVDIWSWHVQQQKLCVLPLWLMHTSLIADEENAVQYACGYIAMKLIKKLEKLKDSKARQYSLAWPMQGMIRPTTNTHQSGSIGGGGYYQRCYYICVFQGNWIQVQAMECSFLRLPLFFCSLTICHTADQLSNCSSPVNSQYN